MEIANVNPTMSIIKCEWSEQPNGKAETVRLDKKIRFNHMLSTRDVLYIQDRKFFKWGKKIYYGNSNHIRGVVVI